MDRKPGKFRKNVSYAASKRVDVFMNVRLRRHQASSKAGQDVFFFIYVFVASIIHCPYVSSASSFFGMVSDLDAL